jgi:2-polyprenyl-3-methyl-5-hydroxy-6-metoxy-1,4-benzoquinol methylase
MSMDKKEADYKSQIYDRCLTGPSYMRKTRDLAGGDRRSEKDYYRAKFSRWLPDDLESVILDIGCGAGTFLGYLNEKGYRNISGLDISPERVSLARKSLPEVEFQQGNLFDFLADKMKAYDCIVALDVIEHLEKERVLEFLDAAYRSLRPGGGLILQTPNAASPWSMETRYGDFTHDCCFTPGSLRQLLVMAGFSEIVFQEAGPSPQGIISFVRFVLWKAVSFCFRLYDLVETGRIRSDVYTRVMQCYARKTE